MAYLGSKINLLSPLLNLYLAVFFLSTCKWYCIYFYFAAYREVFKRSAKCHTSLMLISYISVLQLDHFKISVFAASGSF